MLSKDEIIRKVSSVPFWGQSIPLPYGIVTPGKVMGNLKTLERLKLPNDLKGKRVLDIGAWDGFYSFECEKRGAKILAIDNYERMERPDEIQYSDLGNRGFLVAREVLESNVEYLDMDVYDINTDKIGKFDIVLFLGVFYHLKNPLLAIEKIFNILNDGGIMWIESEYMRTLSHVPLLNFCKENNTFYNLDPTNWFIPNKSALENIIRNAGFKKVELVYESISWKKYVIKSILKFNWISYGRIILKACK